jgi:hypothetical protein
MNEPTISCPNCGTEIKLTESLAAPLIQATRLQYEKQIADKETAFARREALIRDQQLALSKAQDTLDEQVTERLKTERERIAVDEAKKARLALGNDLDQKIKEVRFLATSATAPCFPLSLDCCSMTLASCLRFSAAISRSPSPSNGRRSEYFEPLALWMNRDNSSCRNTVRR